MVCWLAFENCNYIITVVIFVLQLVRMYFLVVNAFMQLKYLEVLLKYL